MTEPKLKADKEAGNLSQTTKSYLREIFREVKYNRRNEFESKYTIKGKECEESGITLFSRVTKTMYKKNLIRLSNGYITGEIDLSDNEDITKCKKGVDIKCSWSVFTFPFPDDKLTDAYEYQDHGYIWLTGAEEWETAFCLVNAPASLIRKEKLSTWYKMDSPEQSDPLYQEYLERCWEIEKNLIFNMTEFKNENKYFDLDIKVWSFDVPLKERVVSFPVNRDEDAIIRIKNAVIKSRIYLNSLNNIL